jgi:hypothetical protein
MTSELPFIVQWSEGSGDNRVSWWIKNIQPDRYFGEFTSYSPRAQANLEGVFSQADLDTLQRLIQEMRRLRSDATDSKGDGYALLAMGTRSKPDILYRYASGAQTTEDKAQLFLKIVELLRKYVEPSLGSAKSA